MRLIDAESLKDRVSEYAVMMNTNDFVKLLTQSKQPMTLKRL